MSALWTPGRAGVSPRGSWWHSPALWNHRHSCLRPCVVCRTQPLPPGGTSHVTNVMTSNIELYLAPARRPAGHGSTPTPPASSRLCPAPASSRPTPRGSGSTGQGLCVLYEGPTYPQYPQPSSSSTPPSCSASRRRRQPPQSPGRPSPTSPSSSSPLLQTHPADVLRSHDIRNSQKT